MIEAEQVQMRPGGAGLTARLAARAGADVMLVTALGQDESASTLRRLLGRIALTELALTGSTMVKTRIRDGQAPRLRLDSGDGQAAAGPVRRTVVDTLLAARLILVADYGRGVAALSGVREALAAAIAAKVPVVWDPHPRGPAPVPGCTLVTPNTAEAAAASGESDPTEQGRVLCRNWRAEAVAVTIGEQGAVLARAQQPDPVAIPSPSASAADDPDPDTCGAGDALAATAAAALWGAFDTRSAVEAGVRAASSFVRTGGVAAMSMLASVGWPLRVVHGGRTDALSLASWVRRSGGCLVATGGCFDLLHRDDVDLLEYARGLGDALIVCLGSDDSVRRAMGPSHPVASSADRTRVLLGLACVDAVAVFSEDTPVVMLERLRPDVWVSGGDHAGRDLPETAVVERHGGRVVLVPRRSACSTSRAPNPVRDLEQFRHVSFEEIW